MSFEIKEALENASVYVEIENLDHLTKRSIRHGFFEMAKDLRTTANKEILRRDTKTGRVYIIRSKKTGRRRKHRASAPGETHANLSGALRRSLGWIVYDWRGIEFGYGTSARKPAPPYSKMLEFGTRGMAARPSLRNAIAIVQPRSEKYFFERFK